MFFDQGFNQQMKNSPDFLIWFCNMSNFANDFTCYVLHLKLSFFSQLKSELLTFNADSLNNTPLFPRIPTGYPHSLANPAKYHEMISMLFLSLSTCKILLVQTISSL